MALDRISERSVDRAKLTSRFFYHISKDIFDEIQDTREGEKIAEKAFAFLERDSGYWARSGPFTNSITADRFCKGFANSKFEKIKNFLSRFGYNNYRYDLQSRMRGEFLAHKNMIDQIVDLRNNIAHGDPNANKTPAEVKEMIIMVRRFCRETDIVFSSWCSNTLCSIR